jgi:hypothetical protein
VEAAQLRPHDALTLRFHDLRHTFASVLVAQGANVVFLSRQLGHASPDITLKVYAHLFDAAEHAQRAGGGARGRLRWVAQRSGVETSPGHKAQLATMPMSGNLVRLRP